MNFSQIWRTTARQYSGLVPMLRDLSLLVLAFFASLYTAPFFRVPYKNPYNISNPLNPAGFNPENNFYSILFVTIATPALFLLLRYLYRSKFAWTIKLLVIGLILVNFFLVNLLPAPGYQTGPGGLDHFHAGEQLSPASSFLKGTALYNEMFFLRGAGVDVLLPVFSFALLGQSIGSYLVMTDLYEFLAVASFLTLLFFLIRNPLQYTAAAILFYTSTAMELIHIRDLPVWIIFGLVLLLFRPTVNLVYKRIILVVIGLISGLTVYLSIDRGILLVMLAGMVAATLIIFGFTDKGILRPMPRTWLTNLRLSLYVLLGFVVGFVGPAILLGTQSFIAFLRMSFIEIPSYGGLLVSQPFPHAFGDTYLFWGPVFLAIATGLLLIRLYGLGTKKDFNTLIPYTLLFLFGVLCLKVGTNRIALSKLASATAPLYLIAILILVYGIVLAYRNRRFRHALFLPIMLAIVILGIFAQLNLQKLLYQPDYTRAQLAEYKNLRNTDDNHWLDAETVQIKQYVQSHTTTGDYIFAFTSDPVYYYFTDRKNPSRFNVSWFADPQPYTMELLNDLKSHKPKLVIYKNGTWTDAPDTIPMETRMPEVNEWILRNYPRETKIGNTIIREP